MAQKSGLGRGLGALIPGGENALTENGVILVPVDLVFPNPRQPRSMMHPEELVELTTSIREHGVLQPLIVTPGDMEGRYVLIAGERRLQAARLAGLATVPVLIRQATDQQRLELAIIENVQRSDLSPLEQAEAYRQLAIGFRLLQGRQVGTLNIFNDSQFQALLVGGLPDEHRHGGQSCQPGCLQTAFPGNQDIASFHVAGCDNQRLENPMLPDGGRQIL